MKAILVKLFIILPDNFSLGKLQGDWSYEFWNGATAKYLWRRDYFTGKLQRDDLPAHYGAYWTDFRLF